MGDRVGTVARSRGRGSNRAAGRAAESLQEAHRIASDAVIAGRERLLADWAMPLTTELRAAKDSAEELGHTPVLAGWDGAIRAVVVVVADTVEPTSNEAITALRALGLTPVLLTGDNERAARAVADQVGIETVIAEVLPADKVRIVERLQAEGKVVAMIGDGVNDAAAGLLNPLIAGSAMGLSSVFVVSNSLRLRRFHSNTVPTYSD